MCIDEHGCSSLGYDFFSRKHFTTWRPSCSSLCLLCLKHADISIQQGIVDGISAFVAQKGVSPVGPAESEKPHTLLRFNPSRGGHLLRTKVRDDFGDVFRVSIPQEGIISFGLVTMKPHGIKRTGLNPSRGRHLLRTAGVRGCRNVSTLVSIPQEGVISFGPAGYMAYLLSDTSSQSLKRASSPSDLIRGKEDTLWLRCLNPSRGRHLLRTLTRLLLYYSHFYVSIPQEGVISFGPR